MIMADGHITVTVNARADEVQGLLAEVDRLRGLAERAADMLTAYGELIRRDGASHVEEHHYLPEVEHTARELRECALGPNVAGNRLGTVLRDKSG